MNYEKNIKYFKSNDKHFYVGAALLAIGIICFVLAYIGFYFLPYHEITSVLIMIIGAAVAFVPRSFRSNENDIDEAVARKTKGYEEQTSENAVVYRMISRKIKPCLLGDYVFGGENVLIRRGKDDRRYRSTVYTAAALVFTNVGIYISQKTFSLVEEVENESIAQFIYEDLDGVHASEEEITLADGGKIKTSFLVFTENGKEALRVPAKRGYALDSLCDDINHEIAEAKRKK